MQESQHSCIHILREKAELLIQNTLPYYSKTFLHRYNNHFKSDKKLDIQLRYMNIVFTLELQIRKSRLNNSNQIYQIETDTLLLSESEVSSSSEDNSC